MKELVFLIWWWLLLVVDVWLLSWRCICFLEKSINARCIGKEDMVDLEVGMVIEVAVSFDREKFWFFRCLVQLSREKAIMTATADQDFNTGLY